MFLDSAGGLRVPTFNRLEIGDSATSRDPNDRRLEPREVTSGFSRNRPSTIPRTTLREKYRVSLENGSGSKG